jgi:hypothetical protein
MAKSKKILKRKNKSIRKNKKMRWGGAGAFRPEPNFDAALLLLEKCKKTPIDNDLINQIALNMDEELKVFVRSNSKDAIIDYLNIHAKINYKTILTLIQKCSDKYN